MINIKDAFFSISPKRGSYNNNRILYNTKCIQLLR